MRLRAYSRASVLSGDTYHKDADCFAHMRFRVTHIIRVRIALSLGAFAILRCFRLSQHF